MALSPKPDPNPALLEMLARSGELDAILSGRGLIFDNPPPPPVPPPQPLRIEPPDWDAEHRAHEAAEQAARLEEAHRLLDDESANSRQARPARKRLRRRRKQDQR